MSAKLDELAAAFARCTLPKAAWTHDAHLRVGLWHVLRHGPDDALALLRERIRALNESHGVANSDSGGYHETITRFYVWRIAAFVEGASATGEDDDTLADRLVAECGAKDLALGWWSEPLLMSTAARKAWVEPDLRPLDPWRSAPGAVSGGI